MILNFSFFPYPSLRLLTDTIRMVSVVKHEEFKLSKSTVYSIGLLMNNQPVVCAAVGSLQGLLCDNCWLVKQP